LDCGVAIARIDRIGIRQQLMDKRPALEWTTCPQEFRAIMGTTFLSAKSARRSRPKSSARWSNRSPAMEIGAFVPVILFAFKSPMQLGGDGIRVKRDETSLEVVLTRAARSW
jgi:hypothetical protein